jgi:hypothetical protein
MRLAATDRLAEHGGKFTLPRAEEPDEIAGHRPRDIRRVGSPTEPVRWKVSAAAPAGVGRGVGGPSLALRSWPRGTRRGLLGLPNRSFS